MAKKVVWAICYIELDVEDGIDDESTYDYANDALVDAGFIVDDMFMMPEGVEDVQIHKENLQ